MKKTTFVFALLWLTFYSVQAQIITENLTSKQKAERYLNTKGEVCFTFRQILKNSSKKSLSLYQLVINMSIEKRFDCSGLCK